MDSGSWAIAGPGQQLTPGRIQFMERRTQERLAQAIVDQSHIWIATLAYFVDMPLADGLLLDLDNLVHRPLVCCFICEEAWTPRIHPVCQGDPQGHTL